MYRITKVKDKSQVAVTETVDYIRIGNSGCFTLTTKERAIGVAVNGIPYNLAGHTEIPDADEVNVWEFDAGAYLSEYENLYLDVLADQEYRLCLLELMGGGEMV